MQLKDFRQWNIHLYNYFCGESTAALSLWKVLVEAENMANTPQILIFQCIYELHLEELRSRGFSVLDFSSRAKRELF